jgi:hypothetical protein
MQPTKRHLKVSQLIYCDVLTYWQLQVLQSAKIKSFLLQQMQTLYLQNFAGSMDFKCIIQLWLHFDMFTLL